MVQFLSINFFSWISSIFIGFFKSSRFFVSLCTYPETCLNLWAVTGPPCVLLMDEWEKIIVLYSGKYIIRLCQMKGWMIRVWLISSKEFLFGRGFSMSGLALRPTQSLKWCRVGEIFLMVEWSRCETASL